MKLNDLFRRNTRSSRELFISVLTSLIKGFFPRDVIRYSLLELTYLIERFRETLSWDIVKMDRADTSGFVSGGGCMLKLLFLDVKFW